MDAQQKRKTTSNVCKLWDSEMWFLSCLVSSLLFHRSHRTKKSESDFRLFLIPGSISLCSDSLFATETKFTSSKGSKGEIRDTQRAKRIAPNFDVLLHQAFPLDIYILYITYEAFVFTVSSQFDVKNEILNKCITCIENVKIKTYYWDWIVLRVISNVQMNEQNDHYIQSNFLSALEAIMFFSYASTLLYIYFHFLHVLLLKFQILGL